MPAMKAHTQKKTVLTLDVSSPFDGSLIRTIPMQGADDAEAMLEKAVACYRNRDGWLEHHERIAILEKLAISIDAEADDFALLIAQEGGKPLTDARVEVARAIDGIGLAIKELSQVMRGEEIPMGYT
ncbi:MAG: aldehyde dehydrogenase family protein, partial [Acidobacteriota bacterium]